MKAAFFFLLFLLVGVSFSLSSCISAPIMAYEYVSGKSDRAEYESKYPEKVMTSEEIERENRQLDAQGYR